MPFSKGFPTLLYTDHRSCGTGELSIITDRATSGKILRWYHATARPLSRLVRIYLKGEANVIADSLSRLSSEDTENIDEMARALPRLANLVDFIFAQPYMLDKMMKSRSAIPAAAFVPPDGDENWPEAEHDVSFVAEDRPMNAVHAPRGRGMEDNVDPVTALPSGGAVMAQIQRAETLLTNSSIDWDATIMEDDGSVHLFADALPPGEKLEEGGPVCMVCPTIGSNQGMETAWCAAATRTSLLDEEDETEEDGNLLFPAGRTLSGNALMNGRSSTRVSGDANLAPSLRILNGNGSSRARGSNDPPTDEESLEEETDLEVKKAAALFLNQRGEVATINKLLPTVAVDCEEKDVHRTFQNRLPTILKEFPISDKFNCNLAITTAGTTQLFGAWCTSLTLPKAVNGAAHQVAFVKLDEIKKDWPKEMAAAATRLHAKMKASNTTRNRYLGIYLPRRIMRKTDARGDSIYVDGKEDGIPRKQFGSFATLEWGLQGAMDRAWKAFGEALRAAETRASDGVSDRHHTEFRIFRKPAVPRPLANHVLQTVFSTTASWDPVSDFLEDHVPCTNFTIEEEVYVGRQRCQRCRCRCGEGIKAFDLGITQVNEFFTAPYRGRDSEGASERKDPKGQRHLAGRCDSCVSSPAHQLRGIYWVPCGWQRRGQRIRSAR